MYRNPLSSGGYSMSFRFIAQNCSNLSVKVKLDSVNISNIFFQPKEVNETQLEQHANFSYRSLTCMNLFFPHFSSLFSLKPKVGHLHSLIKTVVWWFIELKEKATLTHILSPIVKEILGYKLQISLPQLIVPVSPLPAVTGPYCLTVC